MDIQISPAWFRVLNAVSAEFRRSPRLALTPAQVRRMWALDEQTCWAVLAVLTQGGAIEARADGRYVRAGGAWLDDSVAVA